MHSTENTRMYKERVEMKESLGIYCKNTHTHREKKINNIDKINVLKRSITLEILRLFINENAYNFFSMNQYFFHNQQPLSKNNPIFFNKKKKKVASIKMHI